MIYIRDCSTDARARAIEIHSVYLKWFYATRRVRIGRAGSLLVLRAISVISISVISLRVRSPRASRGIVSGRQRRSGAPAAEFIYTTTRNNSRFFFRRASPGRSTPIYQCKPAYLNWPRGGGRREFKIALAAIFFHHCNGGGGGCSGCGGCRGDAPSASPSASKSAKYLFPFDGRRIRSGSFVWRAARLFRTGMKINYFVNSCVTLAVTGPSL